MNEFLIINKYLKPLANENPESLKLNDDIYYDSKKNIGISVDTYVEGIHFIDSSDPNKFLKKILRSSLSDLYCKGIKPKSYFLSLALNKKFINSSWLSKINKILKSEQKKFSIFLGGGDITASTKLVITIIVLGNAKNKPVLRNNSSIDDDIYVTGNIGDSFLGLNVIKKKLNFGKYNAFFKKKYYEPELQPFFSSYLANVASSSIDISDGLTQDLEHLCTSSNCGALIDLNLLPLSSICKKLVLKNKIKIKNIFSNGDDYQILFTSNIKNRSRIRALSNKLNSKITRIGKMKKKMGIIFKHHKGEFKISGTKAGYTHTF